MTAPPVRKKLIEVALPLDAINAAAVREKSIRHGHPSTLHLWWARRPLAAARAVLFAQLVDDPSSRPELFPTGQAQERERRRLFDLIKELVRWENTTNELVLHAARKEIRDSWRRTCADHADHSRARDLFDPERLPAFHDPFAGGGALPLEAQRLGMEAYASDLNPVAVLINKAMIEIPPKFAGRPPVNPEARSGHALLVREWTGARGLAEDIRFYGRWMRDEAERRIGHLYPRIAVNEEMVRERPDLQAYAGRELTVIAWLWARTVKSPNPAFADVAVPLVSTFMLSTKKGKEAYVEPAIEAGGYRFMVNVGVPADAAAARAGTKLSRGANFRCLMSGAPIAPAYIKAEGMAGRMGARLMAIVAEGDRGRVYLAPTEEHAATASHAQADWKPQVSVPERLTGGTCYGYGLTTFGDLFTDRQLVALTTFSDLVGKAISLVRRDAAKAGLRDDGRPLRDGGTGATAYAEAVAVYLGTGRCRGALTRNSTICAWAGRCGRATRGTFGRQAIANGMGFRRAVIHFAIRAATSWDACLIFSMRSNGRQVPALANVKGMRSATKTLGSTRIVLGPEKIVSTDPPYYDNIGYADLSDFFYVWLRRSLRSVLPDLFATMAYPRPRNWSLRPTATVSKEQGRKFFMAGMTQAMKRLAEQAHPGFPVHDLLRLQAIRERRQTRA